MATLLPTVIINGQKINYVDKIKFRFGAEKREYKEQIDGTIVANATRDDTASTISIFVENNNKVMRDLMVSLYNTSFARDGSGSLIASIIYSNDQANPINFNGGSLMELPEIEDQGTTEYTFKFNYYSKTK